MVDITGLLVFVGDVITDRFGKDIREYDLLSVSVSGVGSDELAERCMKAIADRCGVKVKTPRNREVKLTSEWPPLVISTHERADVLVYNEDGSKVSRKTIWTCFHQTTIAGTIITQHGS